MRHNTLRQDVGNLSIGGGVGGVRNPRGDDGASETPRSVGRETVGGTTAGGNAGSAGGAGWSGGGKAGSTPGGIGGGAMDGSDSGNISGAGGSGGGEDGGGSLDGGIAGQDGGERRNSPSGFKSRKSSTLFAASWSFRLAVKQMQAERVAMGHGSVGTQVRQLERQRRDWLTGLELCPQRWQCDCAFDDIDDGGVASQLQRQSRLGLVLST